MVITDPKLKSFVESPISNEFGLSITQVANACKSYGRFSAWLNSDISQITEVLNIVKQNGVSPAFFASYEATEGYNSKWGWLNHTTQQGSYTNDARSVAQKVVTTSKSTSFNPSWIDYGNPVDFVPQSVKTEGNAHFTSMSLGTIGRAFIPLTAAATWQVYYPNGLKKEYNKVQDYGAPLTKSMQLIEQWGGSITEGGTDPETGVSGISKSEVLLNIKSKQNQLSEDVNIDIGDLADKIFNGVKKMLDSTLYLLSADFYTNAWFKLTKTFDNMQHLNASGEFLQAFQDLINEAIEQISVSFNSNADELFNQLYNEVNQMIESGGGGGEPIPSGERFFPINTKKSGVNFWSPPYPNNDLGRSTYQMDYGWTRDNGTRFHAGYDIGTGGNTSVECFATTDGVVTHVGWQANGQYGWGRYIRIQHSTDSYHTMYAHLVDGSQLVSVGDTVVAGQKIATVGNSPGGYAIHLHFELSKNGEWNNEDVTSDPKPYIKVTGNNETDLPNAI